MDEKENRVIAVERAFGTFGSPLCKPGRILIGEGTLKKMCRRRPKLRQFFLFNDALVYGSIIISNAKYSHQHIMDLAQVQVEDFPDSTGNENGFIIKSPKKSFTVFTFTPEEKSQWIFFIRKYVEECQSKKGVPNCTIEPSPVWIPDSAATVCLHCRRTPFTVFNRRHHCRYCGKVVCDACSRNRWLLPSQSDHPLRVCLSCYSQLSTQPANPNSQSKSSFASASQRSASFSSSSSDDSEDMHEETVKSSHFN